MVVQPLGERPRRSAPKPRRRGRAPSLPWTHTRRWRTWTVSIDAVAVGPNSRDREPEHSGVSELRLDAGWVPSAVRGRRSTSWTLTEWCSYASEVRKSQRPLRVPLVHVESSHGDRGVVRIGDRHLFLTDPLGCDCDYRLWIPRACTCIEAIACSTSPLRRWGGAARSRRISDSLGLELAFTGPTPEGLPDFRPRRRIAIRLSCSRSEVGRGCTAPGRVKSPAVGFRAAQLQRTRARTDVRPP